MSLIVSIETSTNVCSVALHNKGKLIYVKSIISSNSHFENIFLIINNILRITFCKKKKYRQLLFQKDLVHILV